MCVDMCVTNTHYFFVITVLPTYLSKTRVWSDDSKNDQLEFQNPIDYSGLKHYRIKLVLNSIIPKIFYTNFCIFLYISHEGSDHCFFWAFVLKEVELIQMCLFPQKLKQNKIECIDSKVNKLSIETWNQKYKRLIKSYCPHIELTSLSSQWSHTVT